MVIKAPQGEDRRRMRAAGAAPQHRPVARCRPAPDRHRAAGRPARPGRVRSLPQALRGDGPAAGPVRPRHLHGRHRLHARRRRSTLVAVHRRAQGDLRLDLSARAPARREKWPCSAPFRGARLRRRREQWPGPARCRRIPSSPHVLALLLPLACRERVARVAKPTWRRPSAAAGEADALAAARLDFAEALIRSLRTDGAASTLDRIAVARSLHELWHLREEVFSRIARHRDQAEAERRLATLDRHFPRRTRAVAFFAAAAAVDSATLPGM